jgi:hypothetical protein
MINLPGSIYRYFYIMFLGFLFTGCGINDQLPFNQQIKPLPPGPICRVALLPFLNESEFPLGDTIFSKVFAAQFQDTGNFFLVQEGDISKVYQQLQLLPGVAPTLEQLQIIADRVKAQLLITGSIIEMRELPAEHNTINPTISVEVEIRDIRNGRVLWATLHKREGYYYNKTMHFGTIHSVTGLSRQMAVEIINLWFKKGLTQCEASPQF